MSKPIGKCVFCDRSGSLTKSHIWPEWVDTILPPNANSHEQVVGAFATFVPAAKGPAFFQKIKQGHVGTRKPRNTCKRCNGGWMRHIEEATMPFIADLLLGTPSLLDTVCQRLLASFLCLVSMRVEFGSQGMRAVPHSDHHWLMQHFQPNSDWRIWLARYQGDARMDERYTAMHVALSPDVPTGMEYCNTQVTTIVVGQLCAHLFRSTVWTDFSGYEGVHLPQIWPPSNFDIDTSFLPIIPAETLPWLHEAVARETPNVPSG
jgi:hypothetical protein